MSGRLKHVGFRLGVVSARAAVRPQVMDYSSARPDLNAVKAAGFVGLCRYQWIEPGTRPDFNRAKAITKSEYDAILRLGMSVTLNCQVDKADYLGGYGRGVFHGHRSLLHSREMGHPDSRPVILTVQDTGIAPADYNLAVDYMRGFVDSRGMGSQAYYGGTNIGNLCVRAGLAKFIWLPVAATSWSTQPSSWVGLRQLPTKSYPQFPPSSYDENDPAQPDWGQHPYTSTQPPPEVEEIMAFLARTPGGSPLCVAADLSSLIYLDSPAEATLTKLGYKIADPPLTQAMIDRIPNSAAASALMYLASINEKLDHIGVTLTDEQLAELSATVSSTVRPAVRAELDGTKLTST